jgi:16S rRNA G966 N2-methylase RsmD
MEAAQSQSNKRQSPHRRRRSPGQNQPDKYFYEIEVTEGLEAVSREEIKQKFSEWGNQPGEISQPRPGALQLTNIGDPQLLNQLRTVSAVYLGQRFGVPRPKALLGDQNFRTLLQQIRRVLHLGLPTLFKTLYVSAAGTQSRVFQRLIADLSAATDIPIGSHAGDLLIRVRRSWDGSPGWEVLVRLTPRPLSTRPWRVCNYRGALNAPVAYALAWLTDPQPQDVCLNLACGSATIMVERLTCRPVQRMLGCDISPEALDCARENIAASGFESGCELIRGDIRQLPIAEGSVDTLFADLPFGSFIGSHEENLALYPQLFNEAARVTKPNARFGLVTHEIRLMKSLLEKLETWDLQEEYKINLRGIHPRIYLLRRVLH